MNPKPFDRGGYWYFRYHGRVYGPFATDAEAVEWFNDYLT